MDVTYTRNTVGTPTGLSATLSAGGNLTSGATYYLALELLKWP